ncbi:MAG TPA: mechanosensitive ion channel family protein, partial [Rhizobiaceae bacterium]|nr:mechanosensitive ion channel family protein [Rhizobiaceae bacterium]
MKNLRFNFGRSGLLALVALCFAAASAYGQGQSSGSFGTGLLAEQQQIIETLTNKTNELEAGIARSAEDDAALVDIRLKLEAVAAQVLQAGQAFRPRLQEINTRLEQLGPPPAAGQPPEPDIVQLERQDLTSEKAEINALLGVAENLSIRINGLLSRIAEIRRELFSSLLTKRYDISFAMIGDVAGEFVAETTKFWRSVTAWLRFVVQFKLPSVLAATFFALIAAAVLLIGGRRL